MIQKMFSIYDNATGDFGVPFFQVSKAVAVRSFTTFVNDVSTTACEYPEDFVLYELGEFDTQNAEVKALIPNRVCGGIEVKRKPE